MSNKPPANIEEEVSLPKLKKLLKMLKRNERKPIGAVFCDGGLIHNPDPMVRIKNPSNIGGTWSFVMVDPEYDYIVKEDWGALLTCHFPAYLKNHKVTKMTGIENNLTELYAAYKALKALPDGWEGTFYTDNLNVIGRLWGWENKMYSMRAVPERLRDAVLFEVSRMGRIVPVLLDGHPTREQFRNGYGSKGNPVAIHNVLTDLRCKTVSAAYLNLMKPDEETNTKQKNT